MQINTIKRCLLQQSVVAKVDYKKIINASNFNFVWCTPVHSLDGNTELTIENYWHPVWYYPDVLSGPLHLD